MRQDENDSSNIFERLKQRADLNSFESAIKRIISDELDNRREWFVVTYEGFDTSNGLYKVKKIDGSIIYAQAKSIPSSVIIGASLVAFCPSGRYARLFLPL
jgi:hypothetical protein